MELSAGYCKALTFTAVFFLAFPAFSQVQSGKNNISYNAGYRQYKATDSSRRYKPGAPKGNALYYRPEEIDVWYPAQHAPADQPIPYRYFLSLFERRANSFQDSVKYNGLADELLQHFTIGNDRPKAPPETKSFLEAPMAPGHFPLIIYFSSYNGMSYENVLLFENLASRGYIVMSISSIGRYPGNMTTKYPDVLEQVKDAEFALYLTGKEIKNADISKIGVVGFSYGGIAAALFAMENSSVKAVLSLDGSEMHYYGRDKGEDNDFNELVRSPGWSPSLLQCSYAYLESDHKAEDGQSDSTYHLPVPGSEKKYYARLSGAAHEDFSCVSSLGANENKIYESVRQLAQDYFAQTLKDEHKVFDAGLTALLAKNKISLSQSGATQSSGKIILSGEIVDAATGNPLPYASIGIPSGNCGTVSANDGKFLLSVDDTLTAGIVRISSLGYQPKTFIVKDLSKALSGQPVIRLNQQVSQLAEVSIKAGKPRMRIIGNTSQSKFFNVGFPLRDLGSEVSIRVALGSKKVLLRSLNFNISDTRMDSCSFRLNIYTSKNGMPGDNLLKQNIITTIGNKPGTYTVDLAPYHILLSGPVFVSLEWIAGKTTASRGAVFFSAGLLSSSYHRKTTEADWVKFKGLGAAFSLKVEDE